jgi:hypothetical protein
MYQYTIYTGGGGGATIILHRAPNTLEPARGICSSKVALGQFSQSTSVSPAISHSTNCSILIIIRGWYQAP